MNFKSDNTVAVNPEILEAMQLANQGSQASYGHDDYSNKLKLKVQDIFETECSVFLVSTGTAANSLSLKAMAPSYGVVYCAEEAHMNTDESSAPEFFTGGVKLRGCNSKNGKIQPQSIATHVKHSQSLAPHAGMAKAVSITQSTESGTVYSLSEIKAIHEECKLHHLLLHMDGARFTNGLVSLGVSPAEMTWKSGVDILSLGATKNGAMMGELVVIFNSDLAKDFAFYHKQAGQLMSKTRYFAAQFLAWFDRDLWIRNAKRANLTAQVLNEGITKAANVKVLYPVESNELFIEMNKAQALKLMDAGAEFYNWDGDVYRLVTNWMTTDEEVERFVNLL